MTGKRQQRKFRRQHAGTRLSVWVASAYVCVVHRTSVWRWVVHRLRTRGVKMMKHFAIALATLTMFTASIIVSSSPVFLCGCRSWHRPQLDARIGVVQGATARAARGCRWTRRWSRPSVCGSTMTLPSSACQNTTRSPGPTLRRSRIALGSVNWSLLVRVAVLCPYLDGDSLLQGVTAAQT